MQQLDIISILAFSLLIFTAGMSFNKSGKNMKSFFAAGGSVPWGISGLSLFMSFFSAGTFVAWGSIAYSSGWVSIAIQSTMAVAGLIIGFFIAPRWNKTGAITAAEYITTNFGKNTQQVYSYIFVVVSLFTTGAFLYPVAKLVEVSTGIPIYLSVLALGVLITIYTTVGGLWAVIVTDVLQFVVLTAAVLIVVPLSFDKVGGIEGFINNAPENFFNFVNSEYTPIFLVAFGLYNLFFIGGNWAYVQRYTSVSKPKNAKKVGWLFGGLYTISPIIWMLPPMIYRVFNSDLAGLGNEGAYLLMCKEVLPAGMLGLILGGMVFATASSVNTTLNILAGVVTNDIYKLYKPKAEDKQLIKVARFSTIIFGILTILVALMVPYFGGIVEVIFSLGAITGGAMYLPLIWTLFSRRQNGFSMLITTGISLVVNSVFKFITPFAFNFSLNRTEEMILGVFMPALILIVFEILNKNKVVAEKEIGHLHDEEAGEISKEEESDNHFGIRVIAMSITGTGVLISSFGLTAFSEAPIVFYMGLAVLLLGAIIWRKFRKKTI